MNFNKFLGSSALPLFFLSCYVFPVKADITVRLPKGLNIDKLEVSHYPISAISNAKSLQELGVVEENVPVKNDKAVIQVDDKDNYVYTLSSPQGIRERIYVGKGDDLLVEIASVNPYYSVVSGSEIMDGITALNQNMEGLRKEMQELRASGLPLTAEKGDSIRREVYSIFTDFIEEHPTSPVVAYAISQLDDDGFQHYASRLPERVKFSMLYPLVESRRNYMAAEKEKEKEMQRLQSGEVEAPVFSLEDLKGESISLSSFRGKWVILDFWGSWCVWCIKGFPELKDAYDKYAGKLEIIGIDCRESKEAWRDGVRKYQLPWVNLYCPEGSPLLGSYGVQGFPTKVIIDPSGKIRNITVGHNPEFFATLESLLSDWK